MDADHNERWAVTLAFWATLLVAAALLATITLAPKLVRLADLRTAYAANQLRLVALERQANELEQVTQALQGDPRFAEELAKVEFAAVRPGAEQIAMPADLQLRAAERPTDQTEPAVPLLLSLPPAVLEPLATHARLRQGLLAVAAALCLFAFTCLHGSTAARLSDLVRRLRERYRAH